MIDLPATRGFASDNCSGMHPEVLDALVRANVGHQPSYGADEVTSRLVEVVRHHFGDDAEVYPVFNGTGANVLALQSVLPRWGAVITPQTAHINTDEAGAPERVGGLKLLPVPAPGGKLTPDLVDREAWGWGNEHRAQPLAVSISQATEVGTVYTPHEIEQLAEHAHARGMVLHVDGSRLANAAAALDVPLRAITSEAGVDILSLGGTKNGALAAEAVVVMGGALDRAREGLPYLRKFSMQLASKMRFVSAQLVALYGGDLWRRNAEHANEMATRLRMGVAGLPGVELGHATEANGVFVRLPGGVADLLRAEGYAFHDWDAALGEVRWMCSWDTTTDDVDALVSSVARCTGQEIHT
ncbi:threonine aldolase family protein [Propionibacteriaceae bacterium G57]|uniref:threonine aldolase family protein n=1 Tax=Aestuariimicrobium sp. G57 TaxID=3418485 RepID=UPI003DA75C58